MLREDARQAGLQSINSGLRLQLLRGQDLVKVVSNSLDLFFGGNDRFSCNLVEGGEVCCEILESLLHIDRAPSYQAKISVSKFTLSNPGISTKQSDQRIETNLVEMIDNLLEQRQRTDNQNPEMKS